MNLLNKQVKKELLVLGGTNIMFDANGRVSTKGSFVDYIHAMADQFERCTWIASVYEGPAFTTAMIDRSRINVIPILHRNILSLAKVWLYICFRLLFRPYVLMFHAAFLFPVLPVIKIFSKKFVAYLGMDYEEAIRSGALAGIPGWRAVFRMGHEFPLKWADAVIVRGKYLKKRALNFNRLVFETVPVGEMAVPPGTDCNHSHPGDPSKRILFIGKVTFAKGVHHLLQAYRLLTEVDSRITWQLDIVGEGAECTEIKAYARSLNLDRVIFHGWMEFKTAVEPLFARAHVLVCPSFFPEGVPRVIDEALIRGVPVVATRVGGIAEEFQTNEVMLVEPNNPAELCAAIQSIVLNPHNRSKYLEGAGWRARRWQNFKSAADQHAGILLDSVPLAGTQ